MNLKEFYDEVNGDYNDMLTRLVNEDLAKKIVKMFLNDPSFNDLTKGLEDKDPELAFRGAHTLKGVSLNLGLTALANKAIDMTEALRARVIPENYKEYYDSLKEEYNKVIEAIGKID